MPESAMPYVIGICIAVIVGLAIWSFFLKRSNQSLQSANVDLQSKDDFNAIKTKVEALSDSDLDADLHSALSKESDGTDPSGKP